MPAFRVSRLAGYWSYSVFFCAIGLSLTGLLRFAYLLRSAFRLLILSSSSARFLASRTFSFVDGVDAVGL